MIKNNFAREISQSFTNLKNYFKDVEFRNRSEINL